jgi:hypothetical protein
LSSAATYLHRRNKKFPATDELCFNAVVFTCKRDLLQLYFDLSIAQFSLAYITKLFNMRIKESFHASHWLCETAGKPDTVCSILLTVVPMFGVVLVGRFDNFS